MLKAEMQKVADTADMPGLIFEKATRKTMQHHWGRQFSLESLITR